MTRIVRRGSRRLHDLPLFWKIAASTLALVVAMGAAGGYVVVRDLSTRASASLTDELRQRAEDVRIIADEHQESLNRVVAAAVEHPALGRAVRNRNRERAGEILYEIIAATPSVDFLGVADVTGRKLAKLSRGDVGLGVTRLFHRLDRDSIRFTNWVGGGYQTLGPAWVSSVVRPVEVRGRSVGVVMAAFSLDSLVYRAAQQTSAGVGIYDGRGNSIAAAVPIENRLVRPPSHSPFALPASHACGGSDRPTCRELDRLLHPSATKTGALPDGDAVFTIVDSELFSTIEPVERSLPRAIAVSLPSSPAIAAAAGARWRLVGLLGALAAGLMALGGLLTRAVLRQVRPLREASRALGAGDLSARAPVLSGDELGELAGGFNRMADRLQDSVEGRTQFFTSMSHELRTPLFAIIGHAEMMLDPAIPLAGDWRADFGATIGQSGEHILRLVNDILDLARFESGSIDLARSPVDLAATMEGIRQTVAPLVAQAGLTLRGEIPDGVSVSADPTRLRQILFNLVSNAIKYTPRGGTVRVGAAATGSTVEIAVADTGVGIPPEERERIFEPFYQVPGSTPLTGQASSGLGLALTRRLVEALGGAISVESSQDQGTTFRVTLPGA